MCPNLCGTRTCWPRSAGRCRTGARGKTRSPAFPDVPRLAEFYPGLEVTPWLGIFAPAGTSHAVIAQLHEATNAVLADPATAEKIRRVGGLEPYISTPDEFAALLKNEYAKYGEIVKAVGAKVD